MVSAHARIEALDYAAHHPLGHLMVVLPTIQRGAAQPEGWVRLRREGNSPAINPQPVRTLRHFGTIPLHEKGVLDIRHLPLSRTAGLLRGEVGESIRIKGPFERGDLALLISALCGQSGSPFDPQILGITGTDTGILHVVTHFSWSWIGPPATHCWAQLAPGIIAALAAQPGRPFTTPR